MILNGCSLLLVVRCRKLQVLCVAWLGDGTFRPAKFRIFGRELGRCFPWWMMQSPDTRTEISTGWWFGCHFLFSHVLGTIIPVDFHIFQRGGKKPPTSQGCHSLPSFAPPGHWQFQLRVHRQRVALRTFSACPATRSSK